MMIPAAALKRFEPIEQIWDQLDKERPPLSPEEVAATRIIRQGRIQADDDVPSKLANRRFTGSHRAGPGRGLLAAPPLNRKMDNQPGVKVD